MATPQVATDGNAIDAATCNKYVAAGGGKTTVKTVYARIRYNGTAWEVHATTDNAEIVSGNIAFSVNLINVTISGFTVAPVAIVAPMLADVTLWPKVLAVSSTQIQIAFYNDAGTRVTVAATTMDCYLIAVGV